MNFYTLPAEQFLFKEEESNSDFALVLLEGTVAKYKESIELERIEAPAFISEEALLHGGFREYSLASISSDIKFCAIHNR
jgi:hypothetical protein